MNFCREANEYDYKVFYTKFHKCLLIVDVDIDISSLSSLILGLYRHYSEFSVSMNKLLMCIMKFSKIN